LRINLPKKKSIIKDKKKVIKIIRKVFLKKDRQVFR